MKPFYNEALVRQSKEQMLSGASVPPGAVGAEVLQSWARCRKQGVDHTLTSLPRAAHDSNVLNDILDATKYSRSASEELYQLKFQLLSQFGIAILYINDKLSVFSKGGSAELLRELKTRGIKFGTNFSETQVGTTAAALALSTGKPSAVLGEEHFCDLFCPYAAFAFPVTPSQVCDTHFTQDFFISLYIIPVHRLTSDLHAIIHYLGERDYFYDPVQSIRTLAFEYTTRANRASYLLIDENDVIADVNDQFCATFEMYADLACGKKVTDLFPELRGVMDCLRTGAQVTSKSLMFHSLPKGGRNYYINGTPLCRSGQVVGYAITLGDPNFVQRHASKIVNTGAYYTFDRIIGENQVFLKNKQLALQAAQGDSTVLICGESGTGKELFAQSVHNASARREGPFVSINCASIPKELISSELFGYEEGAFTGAKKGGSIGKFEQAHHGTLFLDEIAEMPMDMQSVLLRAIEERTVTRVGGGKSRTVDVRIVAATNQNLQGAIADEKFRLDLYYRLNVMRIDLVPLRERTDDIPILVHHFIEKISQSMKLAHPAINPAVMERLQSYAWPGNIRELRNVVERCLNLAVGGTITEDMLPLELRNARMQQVVPLPQAPSADRPTPAEEPPRYTSYEEREAEQIKALMKCHRGNKTRVAQELNITRATLYRKIKKITDWD